MANIIWLLLAISHFTAVQGALINDSESIFQKPTFNFDFSSMKTRDSASSQVNNLRDSWGDFFSQRSKPVFSDSLVNVVKGSENQVRGTQNEVEGSKNTLVGLQNSIFGDQNSIFGLKNSIFGSKNAILKGNDNIVKGS